MKLLSLIGDSLAGMEEKYGVTVVLKDFYSIMHTKPAFHALFDRFFAHENPYCMYIKSNPAAKTECVLAEHTRMGRTMNENPVRYENGTAITCPFGVREFYFPIRCSGHIIGALVVGRAPCEAAERPDIFPIPKRFSFQNETVDRLYEQYICPCSLPDTEDFLREAALLGETLSMICDRLLADINIDGFFQYNFIMNNANLFVDLDHELKGGRMLSKSALGENRTMTIVINTITYILNHYRDRITIEQIAKYCYCSSSTLSHVFAKNYGMTISKLIHTVRCDRAKVLLTESSLSIGQIALECGFSSADYFTSVFKSLTGVTPTEFRVNPLTS